MQAQMQSDFGGLYRPQGRLDVSDALQPYRGRLDERTAAHVLRRAGFGGTPEEIRRYSAMSVGQAVDSLVRYPSTQNLPTPQNVFSLGGALEAEGPGAKSMDDMAKRAFHRKLRREATRSTTAMQVWWLNRMLTTPAPLQEKMTLLFHGHFTSQVNKKRISPSMMYNQNQLFRQYATGNLRQLVHEVSKDPAMVLYLDGQANVKAHPNENYARELMELFTLGLGNYSEKDIRESARAWTGFRFNRYPETISFVPRFHDDGVKTFMGRSGNFKGDDIVDIIFQQPACSRFFARWLLDSFVYNEPEPELVDGVAAMLRAHDFELAPVLSALFRSNVFFSERAYRALVKAPAEFVVGTYKALGVDKIPASALPAMNQMGQTLFNPPDVAGWRQGQSWLTSSTIIARQNFLAAAVNSQTVQSSSWMNGLSMQPQAASQAIVAGIVQGDVSPASSLQIRGFLNGAGTSALSALSPENYGERMSGAAYLALTTPAYQLS